MDPINEYIKEKRGFDYQTQYEWSYQELNFWKLNDGVTFIYGAGEAAHWLYEIALKTKKLKIEGFVDGNSAIKSYKEYPCIDINGLDKIKVLKKEVNIIVCVGSYSTFKDIKINLIKIGFEKIYYHGYFFEIQYLFFNYENQKRRKGWNSIFLKDIPLIKKAYNLLEDNFSKDLFIELLFSFYNQKAIEFKRHPRDQQYFPEDIPEFDTSNLSNFFICGAYDGDLIRLISSKYSKVDHIVALEPDPEIFARLKKFVDGNQGIAKKIDLEEKAIGLKVARMKFRTGSGLGSKISNDGNIYVDVVSIDSLLKDFLSRPIDLITMDIEGQELHALKGGRKYIQSNKPNLGICTYHKPEHLWQIPIEIHNSNKSYKIYLRNYTSFITETVYYAC
jgi:FkbM family methyltransferase